jgi:hypothetical protein
MLVSLAILTPAAMRGYDNGGVFFRRQLARQLQAHVGLPFLFSFLNSGAMASISESILEHFFYI